MAVERTVLPRKFLWNFLLRFRYDSRFRKYRTQRLWVNSYAIMSTFGILNSRDCFDESGWDQRLHALLCNYAELSQVSHALSLLRDVDRFRALRNEALLLYFVEINHPACMLSAVILYFFYWYFATFLEPKGVLHWIWIQVFVTVLSAQLNHEHADSLQTALYYWMLWASGLGTDWRHEEPRSLPETSWIRSQSFTIWISKVGKNEWGYTSILPPILMARCWIKHGLYLQRWNSRFLGRRSSVGIETCYGLDAPGIESRWGARISAPVQTGPGYGVNHPHPSTTEGKERVKLYLHCPSGHSWTLLGRTLSFLPFSLRFLHCVFRDVTCVPTLLSGGTVAA
jgi:hypothetical protein